MPGLWLQWALGRLTAAWRARGAAPGELTGRVIQRLVRKTKVSLKKKAVYRILFMHNQNK